MLNCLIALILRTLTLCAPMLSSVVGAIVATAGVAA